MESYLSRALAGIIFFAIALLSACATPSAPDFRGRWNPVNRYAAKTTQIPLAKTYVFFATPMDGTLKTMLSRWAKDTGIRLSYQLGADYTLPTGAAHINTSSPQLAASELNTIFAAQGIAIDVTDWQIVARASSATPSESAGAKQP